jgi:DNA-binding transcriptional regulator YhcF (GntR family)
MNKTIEKIVSGELKKGDQLLSVREYSIELKVNVNTVRNAYSELESRDVIYVKRGIGTFITEDSELINQLKEELLLTVVSDFIKKMKALGYGSKEIIRRIEGDLNDDEN